MNADDILKHFEQLKKDRYNIEAQWSLLESFVMPNGGGFYTKDGDELGINWRNRERFDDTAVFSAQSLASTIHSTLTNQASTWFEFEFRDPELKETKEYAEWLDAATAHVHKAIRTSNFHREAADFYHLNVGMGSAFMLHEVDTDEEDHVFQTMPLRECHGRFDARGNLVAFFRERRYTAVELSEEFELATLPEKIQKAYTTGSTERFKLITVIYKNKKPGQLKDGVIEDPAERPFIQKFVLEEGRVEVGTTSGYYSMPVYFSRWARQVGSVWGYSQGLVCMGIILTLQEVHSLTLAGVEKALDPPVTATARGVLGNIDLAARGVTYVETHDALKEFLTNARVDWGNMSINDMRSVVRYAFFQDKLELKQSPAMTATEVNARMEQMHRFLGGALIGLKEDFLDKLVSRVFLAELRAGRLPAMPAGLENKDVDVHYVGALARIQRLDAVDAYRNWFALLYEMATVDKSVLDLPDFHQIANDSGERLGVPAVARRSIDEARQIAKDRQEAEREMMEGQAAKDNASAASNVASAQKKLSEVGQ